GGDVRRLSAAVERTSEHPLAQAVMHRVRDERLSVPQAHDAKALPGRGLEAVVQGQVLVLGSSRLLRELGADAGRLDTEARRFEKQGRTISWLVRKDGDEAQLLGLLAFGDTIKASSRQAVERLRGLGIRTVMLTGDNRGSAQAGAEE